MNKSSGHSPVEIAAYYFPNYHADARNEALHGPGWTEWELLKAARPRFEGHTQSLVPAWGYEDESNPAVMARKIDAAADHAVDVFLFDWYYYEDGPFLGRALDEGFLMAPNRDRLKFALMWANHTWVDIHPAKAMADMHRDTPVLYRGEVSGQAFRAICEQVIERYFQQPNYWKIHGRPYFSIYEVSRFVEGLGSLAAARQALEEFRTLTRQAGFSDLHLNAVLWGETILPGEKQVSDPARVLAELGFDSFSSYVWVHHAALNQFPVTPYEDVAAQYHAYWDRITSELTLPYLSNVTMGWDPSPRTVSSDVFRPIGYPFMSVIQDNTPEKFGRQVARALERIRQAPGCLPALTINAWNEWTEGSYLEPDTRHGMRYLEALRDACRSIPAVQNEASVV